MAGKTQSLEFFAISLHDKCVGKYRLIQSFSLDHVIKKPNVAYKICIYLSRFS